MIDITKITKWISFYSVMIPSVRNGDKTQTRRVIKPQPHWCDDGIFRYEGKNSSAGLKGRPAGWIVKDCPWQPGDLLGVREGYQITGHDLGYVVEGIYLADREPFKVTLTPEEHAKWNCRKFPYRATPGRFMYKSLCRTVVENKLVRVQRIQDISGRDAVLEGWPADDAARRTALEVSAPTASGNAAREWFIALWDSINVKHPWDANGWVWALAFERVA